MTSGYHTPAMADEVVRTLDPRPGQVFVDGTVGGGGHALLVGQRLQPGGTLVAIDRDPDALREALLRLQTLSLAIIAVHGSFRNMRSLTSQHGVDRADCVLLDLGVSSHQLNVGERGFSFRSDAPLDMRMDATQGPTAAELLAGLDEREITRILWEYGEERWAARIARYVVEAREREPVATTAQLADLVMRAVPRGAWPRDIHPATRAFQALRIAVNEELNALAEGLEEAVGLLRPGGRLAVISYHSLEDRIVKQSFARLSGKCSCPPGSLECRCGAQKTVHVLTRRPLTPGEEEVGRNPRARSAKLRVAEKA